MKNYTHILEILLSEKGKRLAKIFNPRRLVDDNIKYVFPVLSKKSALTVDEILDAIDKEIGLESMDIFRVVLTIERNWNSNLLSHNDPVQVKYKTSNISGTIYFIDDIDINDREFSISNGDECEWFNIDTGVMIKYFEDGSYKVTILEQPGIERDKEIEEAREIVKQKELIGYLKNIVNSTTILSHKTSKEVKEILDFIVHGRRP